MSTTEAARPEVPVLLEGSCHCGAVAFTVESFAPYPFCICHCTNDAKTNGVNNVNILGEFASLKLLRGEPHLGIYQAWIASEERKSTHKRHFCKVCASFLWAYDETYPQWCYPFANSIDTPLPVVAEKDQVHIFVESKKEYVTIPETVPEAHRFAKYPVGLGSLAQWHKDRGLYGTYQAPEQKKD